MNNHNPKVTVRMSAYNHEKYVEQAILSIVNQTYQDFELLVIDDGSSDRTPEIIERLSHEHGFYFERQENMGLPGTLNKLIGMANGEYITGCASDDFWPASRLAEQVAAMEENPNWDIVHGDMRRVDSEGKSDNWVSKRMPINGNSEFLALLMRRRDFYATTMMVRKSAAALVGPYDESISVEDFDWMLRAVRCCYVGYQSKVWVYYRKHGGNWTMTSKGAISLADSSYRVARKLGLVWGALFLCYKSPLMHSYENLAGRKRALIFAVITKVGLGLKKIYRLFFDSKRVA